MTDDLRDFVRRLPKAELHIHIEGSLEPEMLFAMASKHKAQLPYATVDDVRAAYAFHNLQSFLDIYYEGAKVLRDESDFYALASAYMQRAHEDGVVHTEIFFDPQTHTERGIPFGTVVRGLQAALDDARERWGITSALLPCFLRHLSEESAMATFEEALAFRDHIAGFGLDSSEVGHPPSKFARVFARVRSEGFHVVAHAGEEGPPAYIVEALDQLSAERIDHGVRCESDAALCKRLVDQQVPLTVCPQSNLKLAVVSRMEDHNLKRLLERGLCVTINSDDPAYFGGYLVDNYMAVIQALGLSRAQIVRLARHSIEASFLQRTAKTRWLERLDAAA